MLSVQSLVSPMEMLLERSLALLTVMLLAPKKATLLARSLV